PVDRDAVDPLAQRARDRDVALRVAEADRRRDVEDALRPARAARGRARRGLALEAGLEELAQRVVHLHGLAYHRSVARALGGLEPGPQLGGQRLALCERRDEIGGAVQHEGRTLDAGAQRAGALGIELRSEVGRGERVAVGLEAPADRVLDVLRRMRL